MMEKKEAIRLLGGTPRSAAEACGISVQAVSQWPVVLTKDIENRVLAALARRHLPPSLLGAAGTQADGATAPKASGEPDAQRKGGADHAERRLANEYGEGIDLHLPLAGRVERRRNRPQRRVMRERGGC